MDEDEFNYREHVLHVSCMLYTVYRELFVYGLNASFCNELQDLKEIFEDDEEFPGDIALLEALDDENIKILLSAMYDIEEYGESILNLNNISENELNEALEEGIGDEYISEYSEEEKVDYHYWLCGVMGYTHWCVFNLLMLCYSLSTGIKDIPQEHMDLLYFPTDETVALLDMEDQNVKLLTELAFKLSETANELCERL